MSDLNGEGNNPLAGHQVKGRTLQRSLSILLPARNVQVTLASHVVQVLEIAGELTDQLEILIIDNGSSDHTLEVAHDLAVRYPQVRVMHHNEQRDCQQAISLALDRASGDIVLAYCSEKPASHRDLAAIRHLWMLRDDFDSRCGYDPLSSMSHNRWIAIDKRAPPTPSFRADGRPPHNQPPRPNFLTTLKDFALGE